MLNLCGLKLGATVTVIERGRDPTTSPTSLQIFFQSIHSIPGVPQEHIDRNVTKCDFAIC